MQLKFNMQETEAMIISAIRQEWPNMIGANQEVTVSISNYDGIKVDITDKENEDALV